MGIAVETNDATERVVDAAARAWRANGHEADVLLPAELSENLRDQLRSCISSMVVIPRLQRLECVFQPKADIGEATRALADLLSEGWSLSALVPVSGLGQAHEALRGLKIDLQGWWFADGTAKFTAPEAP
jgi:hypothetical protein